MPFRRYKVAQNLNKLKYNLQSVLSDHAIDGRGLDSDWQVFAKVGAWLS